MQKLEHLQLQPNGRFIPYNGNMGDLAYDENYVILKWNEPNCHVIFSVAQRGKAANIHFDCDKAGARRVREAIGEFCDFLFWMFDWCTMVMGIIEKSSVMRIAEKLGFIYVTDINNSKVYVRTKNGQSGQ